jgi:hypothetical protein
MLSDDSHARRLNGLIGCRAQGDETVRSWISAGQPINSQLLTSTRNNPANMNIQRRSFLRAAIGGATLLPANTFFLSNSALGATSSTQLSAGDIGVITVGLNNEYLEAEFYLRALTGKGLPPQDTTGAGSPGTVLVNATGPVTFSNPAIQSIAQQLADDELARVRDVRATFASFGLTPPALPTIDLVNSFQLLTTESFRRRIRQVRQKGHRFWWEVRYPKHVWWN